LASSFVRVEDGFDRRVACAHAESPIAGFDGFPSPLLETQTASRSAGGPPRHRGRRARLRANRSTAAGGVALAIVADRAAQKLMRRHFEGLALDVPQRQVQSAQRVDLLAAR